MNGLNGEQFTKAYLMIKKIKHKNIDFKKYTACLEGSINYRIYAEAWYLDALTNQQWDCYVLNDYEAVMPLPFTRKFGIKLIAQPIFCQQLGVFHSTNFTEHDFRLFEKKLNRTLVRSYQFNEENTTLFQPKGDLKVNQLINIDQSYDELYKQFRKNRKADLKKQHLVQCSFTQPNSALFNFIRTNYPNLFQEETLTSLSNLIDVLESKDKFHAVVCKQDEKIIGYQLFSKSKNRLILMASFREKTIRNIPIPTLMNQFIIQEKGENYQILDMEGSNVKSIQEYNSSLSATIQHYTCYSSF